MDFDDGSLGFRFAEYRGERHLALISPCTYAQQACRNVEA
jgi:hypothetical protein